MYALFAYYKGQWRFVNLCPHEEHAVMFISNVKEQFGSGHAYVVKMPDDPIDVDVKNLDWDEAAKSLFDNPH